MTREPDSTAFDAIVASWRAEGDVPEWPDDWRLDEALADPPATDPPAASGAADPPAADHSGPDKPAAEPRADELRRTERPGRGARPAADGPDVAPGAEGAERTAPAGGADRPAIGPHPDRPAVPPTTNETSTAERDLVSGKPTPPGERSAGPAADPLPDEHFVPPEPPPLPRMGPPILVGLTLIGLGLVLVSVPGWVGVPQVYSLPLGLVAIAAGLGWLVLRLWPDPDDVPPPLYLDDPDDPDGGAVL